MEWPKDSGHWLPDVRREPGRGLRNSKLAQRAMKDVTRIIIHHTGVGVLNRFKRQRDRFGWEDPLEAAVHVYARIMNSSGHFVIGYHGEVVQTVPMDWSAWHAGYGGARKRSRMMDFFLKKRYARQGPSPDFPLSGIPRIEPRWFYWSKGRYKWWRKKWYVLHGYESPMEWFPELDVNRHTIGFELLAVPGNEQYSQEQLYGGEKGMGLVRAVQEVAKRFEIPIDRDHILTHSDVCPLSRTTRSGRPWDPPPEKYSFEKVFRFG